ncbi:MAG: GNAT family N-acetyltransferase [Clostridiales bacterium]|jgi:RimJ/RimL family protein N-acetyltransferase|nr:GNAT family N-acetyltransferase [Clostridiales bacterium]
MTILETRTQKLLGESVPEPGLPRTPYVLTCMHGDETIGKVGLYPVYSGNSACADDTVLPESYTLLHDLPTVYADEVTGMFLRFIPHRFGITRVDGYDTAFRHLPGDTYPGDAVTLMVMRRNPPDIKHGWTAALHFDILANGTRVGICSLRTGYNEALFYSGHLSYTVFPKYRGHGYAADASYVMTKLAAAYGMPSVTICCVPENSASRGTARKAGFAYTGVSPIPPTLSLYSERCHESCRFIRFTDM